LAGLASLASCPRQTEPDGREDDATESDGRGDRNDVRVETPPSDRDGDGLCDDSETRTYQTDPDNPDSDRDGLMDGFEVEAYTRPQSATDPSGDIVYHLREGSDATEFIPFELFFRGNGESLYGLLYDRIRGPEALSALDLGPDMVAVAAEPRSAVEEIIGPQFLRVVGNVRLRWEARFTWPAAMPPLGCRRAYMFYGSAFVQERGLYFTRAVILDVQPAESTPGMDAGRPPPDVLSPPPDGTDASTRDRPWPFVRNGFCSQRPGFCR